MEVGGEEKEDGNDEHGVAILIAMAGLVVKSSNDNASGGGGCWGVAAGVFRMTTATLMPPSLGTSSPRRMRGRIVHSLHWHMPIDGMSAER